MIHCSELTKTFRRNGSEVVSLDRVSLEIGAGEFVVVRGPSGSGKTTLLLSIGGMQQPSAGTVTLDGEHDISRGDMIVGEGGIPPFAGRGLEALCETGRYAVQTTVPVGSDTMTRYLRRMD